MLSTELPKDMRIPRKERRMFNPGSEGPEGSIRVPFEWCEQV